MSHDDEAGRLRERAAAWSPSRLPRGVIPSWTASVVAHTLLLFVFATSLKSCSTSGMTGEADGAFREVGIFLKKTNKPDETTNDAEDANDQAENAQAAANLSLPAAAEPFEVSDTPPVKLQVPRIADPTLGPGSPPGPSVASDVEQMIKQGGTPRRAQRPGLEHGKMSFFGVREKGSRFVYVLDASGSMSNYNAIRVAKMELMASLSSLDRTQQFQIIFYNQTARAMVLRGERQAKLYFATDQNRLLARQFIASIRADLGTDHMPALKKALRMAPEVIFLLTDADEPQLTAADLNEIDQLNQGRTRIHCIEFGKGAELSGDFNFLKQLARQNGGTHRYRDVTQFGKQ